MSKVNELIKLEKALKKKKSEKERLEARIEADKVKIKTINDAITLLQAKIITENLIRQNMTFDDLQALLESKEDEN